MTALKLFTSLGKIIFYWGFLQVILIGFSYFGVISAEIHAISGLLITLSTLVMVIAALVGKLGGRTIGLSVLLFVIIFMQGYLLHTEGLPPIARALHPVFGIVVMFYAQGRASGAEKRAMA